MSRREVSVLVVLVVFILLLVPGPAAGQRVLARQRLGNFVEDVTYIDTGPNAGHAAMVDGYELRALPAVGKGHAQAPARTLFDIRDLDVGGVPRGLTWVSSEKRFAIAEPSDLANLIFTDHKGRQVERRPIAYLEDPYFEPQWFEGLAYIPPDAAVYPDHLALVVLGADSTPGNPCDPHACDYATRIDILTRGGVVVDEIYPGGESGDLRWDYGGGLAFLAPDRLLLYAFYAQTMNVLDFDGTILAPPVSTAPLEFEGLVQMPDGRIIAADIDDGRLVFYDQGLSRLPAFDRDIRIGPGISSPVGLGWDGDAGQFLVTHTGPSAEVAALSESLDAATPVAQIEAPYFLPRGAAYIPAGEPVPAGCTPGNGLVAVTNVYYRVGPSVFAGPILLFDKETGDLCHEVEVDSLGIGTPRQAEYLPTTGQLAMRFSSDQHSLQLLSLDGTLGAPVDLESALGSDSVAIVAARFPCDSGECLLVYDYPDRRLVVTDLDGTALGQVVSLEDLGFRDAWDLTYISSGEWEGAFAIVDSGSAEMAIFRLD